MATPRKSAASKTASTDSPTVASVANFKQAPTPVQLPSGNWVVVRRVGLRAFLVNGVIPNSLMGVVRSSLESGVSQVDEKAMMDEMLSKPEKLADLMAMVDAATVYSMVSPRVYATPADSADRDDNLLYADELSEADKMEIFTYATGGTIELEPFRS
jgi:hypothetical protein